MLTTLLQDIENTYSINLFFFLYGLYYNAAYSINLILNRMYMKKSIKFINNAVFFSLDLIECLLINITYMIIVQDINKC